MKIEILKTYKDKKIAILGYGKEGKSSLDFLLNLGIKNITILDKQIEIEKKEGINYNLGESYLDNLGEYDLIIKSPGISPYNEKISPYREKLTSQAEIFFSNYKGKVIGVTGTKGKSTTVTLIFEILKNIGYDIKLVGNIGTPVLEEIDILNSKIFDFIIYELSSYMLETIKPNLYIGVLNNIYDCHLDWHHGKQNYINAKYNILRYSENKLLNYELVNDENINKLDNLFFFGENGNYYYKNGLFYIGEQQVLVDENIALGGEHNRKNISAVIGILDIIDKKNTSHNISKLRELLVTFIGLPYRLENIGIYNGITFINDAIATTPESTIAAIKTFGKNIGTIFLGGQDYGFNFKELYKILEQYDIGNIVLFPDSGESIFGDLSKYNYETIFNLEGKYSPKILKTKSMKNAVDFGYKNTPKGKICILSNAAPSYSLWSGYIQKGDQFNKEVKNYVLK